MNVVKKAFQKLKEIKYEEESVQVFEEMINKMSCSFNESISLKFIGWKDNKIMTEFEYSAASEKSIWEFREACERITLDTLCYEDEAEEFLKLAKEEYSDYFKGDDTMNVKKMFDNMTNEQKLEFADLLFDEYDDELFRNYDSKDAMKPDYGYSPTSWETPQGMSLDNDIWGYAPKFNPMCHAYSIATKWVVKYDFANCLKAFRSEEVQKAIKKAIPCANIVIATPEVLEQVLVKEIKIKIIKELL